MATSAAISRAAGLEGSIFKPGRGSVISAKENFERPHRDYRATANLPRRKQLRRNVVLYCSWGNTQHLSSFADTDCELCGCRGEHGRRIEQRAVRCQPRIKSEKSGISDAGKGKLALPLAT